MTTGSIPNCEFTVFPCDGSPSYVILLPSFTSQTICALNVTVSCGEASVSQSGECNCIEPSLTPTITVTPSITPTPTISLPTSPENAFSFKNCCNEETFTIFTGTSTSFNDFFPIPNVGDVFTPIVGTSPFEVNKCFERINYNSNYTEFYNTPEGYPTFFGAESADSIYSDCASCANDNNFCIEQNISLSGCCDGNIVNVANGYNLPAIGESAVLISTIGLSGIPNPLIVGNCYVRIEFTGGDLEASTAEFTYGSYYDGCTPCVEENTCPSLTPTPTVTTTPTLTVTPTITVTPSITPTQSEPATYTRRNLTPCCTNFGDQVTVITEANINDSLNVISGDIVSLDGVCYTLGNTIEGVSDNTPTSQVEYSDCETCLINQPQTNWCINSYTACVEVTHGAGSIMAQPYQYNTYVPVDNPIGTDYEYLEFQNSILNTNGDNITYTDCYQNTGFDTNLPLKSYNDTDVNQCCGGAKCNTTYIVMELCELYLNEYFQTLVPMSCDLAGNPGDGGGSLSAGDTLFHGGLINETGTFGSVTSALNPGPGTLGYTGSCSTIVGQTSTLNSTQNTSSIGTEWLNGVYRLVDCNDSDCGCREGLILENVGNTNEQVTYKRCGETSLTQITVPANNPVTITECLNVNSVVILSNDVIINSYGTPC